MGGSRPNKTSQGGTMGLDYPPAGRVFQRRHKLNPGVCSYCDSERAANNNFHPAHDASDRCESGKRDHCSCDTCF